MPKTMGNLHFIIDDSTETALRTGGAPQFSGELGSLLRL